jgi:hypothetical protein
MRMRLLLRAAAYVLLTLIFLSPLNLYAMTVSPPWHRPPLDLTKGTSPLSVLMTKKRFYLANRDRFDTLYVGDSRAYFNIDCQMMDARLGTRSYNLAAITHWLPSQYLQLRDLLPSIPAGTTVVLSVGHNLFDNHHQKAVNHIYPADGSETWDFLRMGYSIGDHWANLLLFRVLVPHSDYFPGGLIYFNRERYWEELKNFLAGAVRLGEEAPAQKGAGHKNMGEYLKIKRMFEGRGGVLQVGLESRGRTIINAVIRKTQGNIIFHELESAYFREKQRTHRRVAHVRSEFRPSKKYWNTFREMLDLLERAGLRVIVNEFEEAPYIYGDEKTRREYDGFMRALRNYVEARGIPYIHIDQSRLPDEFYFDADHFNSKGVIWYDPLLAEALRPHLLKRPAAK